jgi:uncharacterized protein
MSINKIIVIFGIILALFAGIVFYQFNTKQGKASNLPTGKITIDGHIFTVEVAKQQLEQEIGLSNRNDLPQDRGMLFVFEKPGYYNFWMKDMRFPLDIIFIQGDKVVSIAENVPTPKPEINNPPLIQSAALSDRVLEINAGLSEKYNIKKNDQVKIEM